MKKKTKIVSIILLSLVAVGIGTASLLQYFGKITTTVDVQQSILLDGQDYTTEIIDEIEELAPGGEEFCFKHILTNDASVQVTVELETTYSPDGDGITTTYNSDITDDNTNFGSRNNEVCGKVYKSHTLDELFSGEGFQYGYTVINGGTYNGAAPIMAIIDLVDGRHIILYAGWGTRTGSHSLQFSDTIAIATSDGGNVPVDFTIYAADFQGGAQWSSNNQYGNWNYLKASGSSTGGVLPLTGSEMIESVSFQHQGANTGQKDRLDWMDIEFEDERNDFIQPDGPFPIGSGEEVSFCLCHEFDVAISPGTYTITTEVLPS